MSFLGEFYKTSVECGDYNSQVEEGEKTQLFSAFHT